MAIDPDLAWVGQLEEHVKKKGKERPEGHRSRAFREFQEALRARGIAHTGQSWTAARQSLVDWSRGHRVVSVLAEATGDGGKAPYVAPELRDDATLRAHA